MPLVNLYADRPDPLRETFTSLLDRPGIRIERIISNGQSTPVDAPYDQDEDEWVLLMLGAAGLWLEHGGEHTMRPGDALLIPARQRHRVTWTDNPTIWLSIHLA